jgi:hypothetical protein
VVSIFAIEVVAGNDWSPKVESRVDLSSGKLRVSVMDEDQSTPHLENESMLTGAEGKILEEGAKVIIERVVPTLTEHAKMLWAGRKFLILGPPRCGKTSFLNFLEYLILEPEKTTGPTVGVTRGRDTVLRLGPNRSLTLRVRKPRDVAGQRPINEIQYIEDYAPHCIVVVLDASKFWGVAASESSLEWLEEFCRHLDVLLLRSRKVAKKLKAMTVVLNKWDKIPAKDPDDDKVNRQLFETYVREILNKTLHNSFYTKDGANVIDIIPCVLVKSRLGNVPASSLVQSIALALARE